MNNLKIRPYKKDDFNAVSQLFEDFIDYLVKIDPDKRIIKQKNYGHNYLNQTLKEIKNNNSLFLVAEIKNIVIGLGIAVVEKLNKKDLMETIFHTPGRITELFINNQYRGQGIGKKIMEQLEIYLKQNDCNLIHIEVFAPNDQTRKVYKKLGYSDRNIDMVKII